jgi:hypothetical protein
MGWSFWDDYNERNSDREEIVLTPEQVEARRIQSEQAKQRAAIRDKKRAELRDKFGLTKGQLKRLSRKGDLDRLLRMSPLQLQTELRKCWRGKNDVLSMKIKGA